MIDNRILSLIKIISSVLWRVILVRAGAADNAEPNGVANAMLTNVGLIDAPVQFMFTQFGVVTALVRLRRGGGVRPLERRYRLLL